MKPIVVLAVTFVISALITRFTARSWNLVFAGSMAMCMMLCFTALWHFLVAKGMAMMIPPFIPYPTFWVYATGVLEIFLGLTLLSPALRPYAGWVIITFLILIFPANVYAAIKHIDLEKADHSGPGLAYLWFRVPEQLLFIGWVYYFAAVPRGIAATSIS